MERPEAYLLCWALEAYLSTLHSLSPLPHLTDLGEQVARRLSLAYYMRDSHSCNKQVLAPAPPGELVSSESPLFALQMENGNSKHHSRLLESEN